MIFGLLPHLALKLKSTFFSPSCSLQEQNFVRQTNRYSLIPINTIISTYQIKLKTLKDPLPSQ